MHGQEAIFYDPKLIDEKFMCKVLVIEDDIIFQRGICNLLERQGWKVIRTLYISKARKILQKEKIDLVLSDIHLPDGDGLELLEWLKLQEIEIPPYILITQYGEVSSAVKAMKLGAEDYICKPPDMEKLLSRTEYLLQQKKVQVENTIYHRKSKIFQEIEQRAKLVAATDISVLIRGDNGTGKEYIARLIHQESDRKDKAFIPVDCGSIPKELAASEFFGHRKGSFTGAIENHRGFFQDAEGGTLFLDEIGNLPHEEQVMLLRTIQERKFRPIGEKKEISVNIRIISATNENLEQAIADGKFREDLYHRLNEFTVSVPTLRESKEDILPLAEFFLKKYCIKLGKTIKGFNEDSKYAIKNYIWHGNVREMQFCIQKAVILAENDYINILDLELPNIEDCKDDKFSLKNENKEKRCIIHALEMSKGNRKLAAKILHISRTTLYKKMKKYHIEIKSYFFD